MRGVGCCGGNPLRISRIAVLLSLMIPSYADVLPKVMKKMEKLTLRTQDFILSFLWSPLMLTFDSTILTSLLVSTGILFEVRRVELQDPAVFFCVWVVKDLLQSQKEAVAKTQLLLSSLASSTQSVLDLSTHSLGEVRNLTIS